MSYTMMEMMIVEAARLLSGPNNVFMGVGLPTLAVLLAKETHAPEINIICESGIISAAPSRLPLSISDPGLVTGSVGITSPFSIFTHYLQGGKIDIGILGGAQVDQYGNLNSTLIGQYRKPDVR
ncbi:MAG: CoA-transferase, partial [Bacillota bacterium]